MITDNDAISKLAEEITQQIENASRHIGGYGEDELKQITSYWHEELTDLFNLYR